MKKYLMTLFIGFAIFLIGITCFYLETINFDINTSLTSNFNMQQEVLEYEINEDRIFRITSFDTDKNVKLFVDNSLSDKIKIIVNHSDMMKIENDYYTITNDNKDLVKVNFKNDLILDWQGFNDLYALGITSLKNKTIYNYTLLKYPEIKIYVNENYRSNVEFVNQYGQKYNPIR